MPFIRSENVEDIVKAIVSKAWPTVTSRGMLNVSSQNPTGLGKTFTGKESGGNNAPRLFICGTSAFGGKRVVGA